MALRERGRRFVKFEFMSACYVGDGWRCVCKRPHVVLWGSSLLPPFSLSSTRVRHPGLSRLLVKLVLLACDACGERHLLGPQQRLHARLEDALNQPHGRIPYPSQPVSASKQASAPVRQRVPASSSEGLRVLRFAVLLGGKAGWMPNATEALLNVQYSRL